MSNFIDNLSESDRKIFEELVSSKYFDAINKLDVNNQNEIMNIIKRAIVIMRAALETTLIEEEPEYTDFKEYTLTKILTMNLYKPDYDIFAYLKKDSDLDTEIGTFLNGFGNSFGDEKNA